ncbi:TrbC/VirB2 family protein [Sphingomonas sp. DG1-23]|uniref:TrbC/VirB2 family protein n=1 Tax=Sphingomonas sp. DG1-23 TaxID=3068316 RepID=UPI00353169BC
MSVGILYPDLADPATPAPLFAAVTWIERTVLGSVATSIAVIAVAVVGLMMLRGRLEVRRGVTVILGCFVLFGAPVLAAGIRGIASNVLPAPPIVPAAPPPPPMPIARGPSPMMPPPPPEPSNYDPYAGASVRPH